MERSIDKKVKLITLVSEEVEIGEGQYFVERNINPFTEGQSVDKTNEFIINPNQKIKYLRVRRINYSNHPSDYVAVDDDVWDWLYCMWQENPITAKSQLAKIKRLRDEAQTHYEGWVRSYNLVSKYKKRLNELKSSNWLKRLQYLFRGIN